MSKKIAHPSSKATVSLRSMDVEQQWFVVDAAGQTLGRLASQVASIIRGKHKPSFTPHVECGDSVIVINADKIHVEDKRVLQKEYFHYTGYPGGGRVQTMSDVLKLKPEFAVEHAVKGMLPKNRLGRVLIKNLRVYSGDTHPHAAQNPQPLPLRYGK